MIPLSNLEQFEVMNYHELIALRHKALAFIRADDPLAYAYEDLVLQMQEYIEQTYLIA